MGCMILPGAVTHARDLAGLYLLQNVREVGSELLLKPDGSFDFVLAHGAADYRAQGKWQLLRDAVVLDSDPNQAKPPVRLARSAAKSTPGVRVFVMAPNGRRMPDIDVAIEHDGRISEARTDSQGVAFFCDLQQPRAARFRIRAYDFESERIVLNPGQNEFTFVIDSEAITQVRFNDERLRIDGETLVMRLWGDDRPMRYARE